MGIVLEDTCGEKLEMSVGKKVLLLRKTSGGGGEWELWEQHRPDAFWEYLKTEGRQN